MTDTEIEDLILQHVAEYFVSCYQGSKAFRLDRDWPRIEGGYFGFQVVGSDRTGESDIYQKPSNDPDVSQVLLESQNTYDVEIIAFRGITINNSFNSPTGMLEGAKRLLENPETLYNAFHQHNLGVTDYTNISKIDTVLDGTDKELRSRMMLTISASLQNTIDTAPIIETVNFETRQSGIPLSGTATKP